MSETNPAAAAVSAEAAPHRYTAAMAAEIEARWQDFGRRRHLCGAEPQG